ncbi:MAG: hypothetical protein K9N51_11610 [Candidatus Pacebacteria bacterium]|nr:hypothetical protein [Candidatus Paceibacterota bacterium]
MNFATRALEACTSMMTREVVDMGYFGPLLDKGAAAGVNAFTLFILPDSYYPETSPGKHWEFESGLDWPSMAYPQYRNVHCPNAAEETEYLAELIDHCHELGMKFYLRTINNKHRWLFPQHDDWKAVERVETGGNRIQEACCWDIPEFMEYYYTILRELLERYPETDGIILDQQKNFGPYVNPEVAAPFRAMMGMDMSAASMQDLRDYWSIRNARRVRDTVVFCRGIIPGIEVGVTLYETANHARTAEPFVLSAEKVLEAWDEARAVLLTVHVPSSAQPGEYRGHITVQPEGLEPTEIPVTVRVLNCTLPVKRSLVWDSWYNLDLIYHFDGNRHRPLNHWQRDVKMLARYRAAVGIQGYRRLSQEVSIWREPDGSLTFDFNRLDPWIEAFRPYANFWNPNFSCIQGWLDALNTSNLRKMVRDRESGELLTLEDYEYFHVLANLRQRLFPETHADLCGRIDAALKVPDTVLPWDWHMWTRDLSPIDAQRQRLADLIQEAAAKTVEQ